MSDPLVPVGEGHTAIGDDERQGLIPTYIATRGELFAAEEANIAAATIGLRPTTNELLDDLYLRRLHRAMFERVWRWAGRYRTREARSRTRVPRASLNSRERCLSRLDEAL